MKINRSSYLALVVVISILPGTLRSVSAQPQSSQHSVVKELQEGVKQVRVEGKSYLLIPVHPDQIDDEQIYHTITSNQENFVVQMKADLEAAKQQLEPKGKEIASYQEEKEKSETVLKLKNEAMGQIEAALDQKNKALERKNEALGVCRAYLAQIV